MFHMVQGEIQVFASCLKTERSNFGPEQRCNRHLLPCSYRYNRMYWIIVNRIVKKSHFKQAFNHHSSCDALKRTGKATYTCKVMWTPFNNTHETVVQNVTQNVTNANIFLPSNTVQSTFPLLGPTLMRLTFIWWDEFCVFGGILPEPD